MGFCAIPPGMLRKSLDLKQNDFPKVFCCAWSLILSLKVPRRKIQNEISQFSYFLKYFSSESYLKKSIVVSEAPTCLLKRNFALSVSLFVWVRRKFGVARASLHETTSAGKLALCLCQSRQTLRNSQATSLLGSWFFLCLHTKNFWMWSPHIQSEGNVGLWIKSEFLWVVRSTSLSKAQRFRSWQRFQTKGILCCYLFTLCAFLLKLSLFVREAVRNKVGIVTFQQ